MTISTVRLAEGLLKNEIDPFCSRKLATYSSVMRTQLIGRGVYGIEEFNGFKAYKDEFVALNVALITYP